MVGGSDGSGFRDIEAPEVDAPRLASGAEAAPVSDRAALSLPRASAAAAHGAGPLRAKALLQLQRAVGNRAVVRVLARELAVAPTVADPPAVTLSADQLRAARLMNEVLFADDREIAVLRDVLGLAPEPAQVDDDFTNALASYQASYGLTTDGKLGPHTSDRLAREL